jgi:putative ABC transport system ATP-binding protein
MEHLVELNGVVKVYPGAGQPALDHVSLTLAAGEVAAIMGPSGSGKSTLLNLVAGLDRPTTGSVRVDGVELTRLGEAALARFRRTKVGLVFQFFNLLDNLTVLDNVAVPAELSGLGRREARRRALDLLGRLGLDGHAGSFPARLSGGQRQRVAVARALVNRPALLLADEPTGALDTRSGERVMDVLRDLNRDGQTIVLVTHDPRLAERCAGRVVRLVDGAVAPDGAALVAAR